MSNEQEFNRRLGAWLHTQRRKAKLSQRALAEQVGTHRNCIDRWEKGKVAMSTFMYAQLKRELERVA